MTRLTRKDMQELRRSYAKTLIADEILVSGPQSAILQAAAQKAITSICQRNILPADSITTAELIITTEPKPSTNQTEYLFRWEPQLEDFQIELAGGPRDGETLRIPESMKGEIRVPIWSNVKFETDSGYPEPAKHGRYQESGWDTETKVWIYEWKGTF